MNDQTKLSDLTVGEFKELMRGLNNFTVTAPPTKTTGQIQAEAYAPYRHEWPKIEYHISSCCCDLCMDKKRNS